MKKMLIGLLMLAVATGAFAQVSIAGSAQLDLGIYDAPTKGGVDWYWDFLDNGGTFIQANAKFDKVTAWLRFRGSMHWMGDVTVDLDPVKLSIGRNRLPVAFWSSYELYGDEHYGIGASATNRSTYIQAKIGDFFIGIADSEKSFKNPFYDPDDSDSEKEFSFSYLNDNPFTSAFSPIAYLGYDFKTDAFSVGASFVGVYLSKDLAHTSDGVFSFMGNVHFNLLALDPIGLGLNVSLYGSPLYGPFTLTSAIIGGKGDLVLEALLNLSVGIENVCEIGFGAGFVMNFESGGLGTKLGLSAIFDLGGTGFSLVPGVAYTLFTDKAGGANTVDAGLSFMYSF